MHARPSGSMLWFAHFHLPMFPLCPCLSFLAFSCSLDVLLDPLPFPLSSSSAYPLIALIPHFLLLQNVDVLTPGVWPAKDMYLPAAPRFLSPQKRHLQPRAPPHRSTCHPPCSLPSSPSLQKEQLCWTKSSSTPMRLPLTLWATVWGQGLGPGGTRGSWERMWVLQLGHQPWCQCCPSWASFSSSLEPCSTCCARRGGSSHCSVLQVNWASEPLLQGSRGSLVGILPTVALRPANVEAACTTDNRQ